METPFQEGTNLHLLFLDPQTWPLTPIRELKALRNLLKEHTLTLMDLSYSPINWTNRAKVLILLGYHNLATSDLHKAILLLDAALYRNGVLGEKVWLQVGMTEWIDDLQNVCLNLQLHLFLTID